MSSEDTRGLIRAFLESENEDKQAEFRSLGYKKKKNRYTQKQKNYAMNKAQESGVRTTARILELPRKTLQRWLRDQGIWGAIYIFSIG